MNTSCQSGQTLPDNQIELAIENRILARELARVQERYTDWNVERHIERQTLQAEIERLRAELVDKDTAIAGLAAAFSSLKARSVLCVGARSGYIPIYRELFERHGGHFAHHDGDVGADAQRLDQHLAEADLVICQTGCLSHDAYWRVQDHCKRTGKRCVCVNDEAQRFMPLSA